MLKLNPDDPTKTAVETVDGREAKILEVFEGRIFGRVKSGPDGWAGCSWGSNGICGLDGLDLVNVPEKRLLDVWIAVDNFGDTWTSPTEKEAKLVAGKRAIACVHVSQPYTVGEGLDQ